MPFCPQCSTEYREGFTRCSDCNIELSAASSHSPVEKPASFLLGAIFIMGEFFLAFLFVLIGLTGISNTAPTLSRSESFLYRGFADIFHAIFIVTGALWLASAIGLLMKTLWGYYLTQALLVLGVISNVLRLWGVYREGNDAEFNTSLVLTAVFSMIICSLWILYFQNRKSLFMPKPIKPVEISNVDIMEH